MTQAATSIMCSICGLPESSHSTAYGAHPFQYVEVLGEQVPRSRLPEPRPVRTEAETIEDLIAEGIWLMSQIELPRKSVPPLPLVLPFNYAAKMMHENYARAMSCF